MEIMQLLNMVSLMVNAGEPNPEVNIELENSTCLRITQNSFSRYYLFKKDVLWPAMVRVTRWGIIELVILKKEEKMWDRMTGIRSVYQGLKPIQLPDFYKCRVLKNEHISPLFNVLTLQINSPNSFVLINPGKFLMVKQSVNGKEWRSTFVPVPLLPLQNFSYPNPKPGEWMGSMRPVHLLVGRRGNSILNSWLLNRTVGDSAIIGNPIGNFKVGLMEGAKRVYLAANGIGLAPLLSILLWVLQTTSHARVYLGVFNTYRNESFWEDEIKSIERIEPRLRATFVLQNLTEVYVEDVGIQREPLVNANSFKKAFPKKSKKPKLSFFCISGRRGFARSIKQHINYTFGLPKKRMYVFRETFDLFKYKFEKPIIEANEPDEAPKPKSSDSSDYDDSVSYAARQYEPESITPDSEREYGFGAYGEVQQQIENIPDNRYNPENFINEDN